MMWCAGTSFLLVMMIQFSYARSEKSTIGEDFCLSILDSSVELIKKVRNTSQMNIPAKEVDCAEILSSGRNQSGIYTVWPRSRMSRGKPLEVYCDMQTDGGGWTVIQRRGDFGRDKEYFRKEWKYYKEGFGDIDKDFWLGNDNIFSLTNQDLYSARFDLQDVEGEKRYAVYDTFYIDDEDRKYTLHIKGYRGDAGDSMVPKHDNQKFTTKDQKNDNHPHENCANLDKGAWWYNYCLQANLNGLYLKGKYESPNHHGLVWFTWKGNKESMVFTEIKIRPKDFRPPKKEANINSQPSTCSCTPHK